MAALVVAPVVGLGAEPASALTPNENFIVAVHEDFLQRGPSYNELTWWSAYIGGGGTRASMVANVLDSSEFKQLWLTGVRQYYLGEVDFEDPQFATDLSNLVSTDDFVASEVAVLASTRYFNYSGGTNTAYVESLYQHVLLRPSDSGGLTYWVGRLNAATATRASVAAHFIRTTEGATRRVAGASGATSCATTVLVDEASLAAGSYCLILDRMADSGGTTYWVGQLTGTNQLPSLWASLAGSTEYFNNAQ
jgi:hypothetical protein